MEGVTILEWESKEHPFDKKEVEWYWTLGIIATGIAVLAFYFDNFLLGILVIVASFTIGLLSYKETKTVEIKITTKGIVFGRKFYSWSTYRSFWIESEHLHGPRILFHPNSSFLPLMPIPVNEEIDLYELRETLLEILDEEPMQESFLHQLFDKIIAR